MGNNREIAEHIQPSCAVERCGYRLISCKYEQQEDICSNCECSPLFLSQLTCAFCGHFSSAREICLHEGANVKSEL